MFRFRCSCANGDVAFCFESCYRACVQNLYFFSVQVCIFLIGGYLFVHCSSSLYKNHSFEKWVQSLSSGLGDVRNSYCVGPTGRTSHPGPGYESSCTLGLKTGFLYIVTIQRQK
jgi:hypothetical protein